MLPIRSVISYSAESIVNLVRALRRSGSDFLVEEDLAAIFGRVKIEPSLEHEFRDVVKIASFTPLHAQSSIVLDAGPGPTLLRALKDRYYMALVIQLSFLVWMHEETTLATALVESMRSRYESGVQNTTPDPDYDGILRTLQACSSQTSQYRWDNLVALVVRRFPASRQLFRMDHSPLKSLSPNLLLGAMDYFYLVQSLPEDRFVIVESQRGVVPIIVWGHYILGLTVLVNGSPDGDVIFGRTEGPQIIIKWSSAPINPTNQVEGWLSAPMIYLLDASQEVLLQTEPVDNESTRIEGQECHCLKGYGTTFLQRLFNKIKLVEDDDPIYVETANFAVAFALLLSRSMRRDPISDEHRGKKDFEIPAQCYLSTEPWRLFNSSKLLFAGIELDKRVISGFAEKLTGVSVADMTVPPGIRNYLEKPDHDQYAQTFQYRVAKDHFIEDIEQIASWVLTFAQVVDIESCADLVLIIAPGWMFCNGVVGWNGLEPIEIESKVFFDLVLKMMRKDTTRGTSIVDSEGIFLTSHHGWSLFHSSVGDCDPGQVNCKLLSIKRGVPTNTQTGERKYRIADAPAVERIVRTPIIIDKGNSYLSRCLSKVHKRTEHYSSRIDEFLLSIRFDIEDFEYPQYISRRNPEEGNTRYSIYASQSHFHEALWGIIKTIPCTHPKEDSRPLPLDLGTVTVAGLTWANGDGQATSAQRICICLVNEDARARWLVVHGLIPNSDAGALRRQVLLRCDGCCEDCAVKAASAMQGNWLVVL
ncbi:MAG: hypothetical protein Q9175_007844 [Cornicularia normoerica]